MPPELRAVFFAAAIICFLLAATNLNDRFADRTRMIAIGLACGTVVCFWQAVSAI